MENATPRKQKQMISTVNSETEEKLDISKASNIEEILNIQWVGRPSKENAHKA